MWHISWSSQVRFPSSTTCSMCHNWSNVSECLLKPFGWRISLSNQIWPIKSTLSEFLIKPPRSWGTALSSSWRFNGVITPKTKPLGNKRNHFNLATPTSLLSRKSSHRSHVSFEVSCLNYLKYGRNHHQISRNSLFLVSCPSEYGLLVLGSIPWSRVSVAISDFLFVSLWTLVNTSLHWLISPTYLAPNLMTRFCWGEICHAPLCISIPSMSLVKHKHHG